MAEVVFDLPKTSQWMNRFKDIVSNNFDADREPLRGFKHSSYQNDHDFQKVCPGSVDLQRGFTRVTILLFASHWGARFFLDHPEVFQSYQHELATLQKCPASH